MVKTVVDANIRIFYVKKNKRQTTDSLQSFGYQNVVYIPSVSVIAGRVNLTHPFFTCS